MVFSAKLTLMLNQFNVSLWGDESWAATLAVKPVWQIIKIVSRDTSPPLYYLIDHFWMKVFGTSEVSIRTLTCLFFLGTVFLSFLIAKYLWDEKTGLWAAALTFTSPFLFKYAFEGRMYALLALTTTASMYFYLTKKRWGHILATLAALYTHHFAIFAVLVQIFWQLSQNRPKLFNQNTFKKLVSDFTNFLIIGLLYLPWLYPLYRQTSLVSQGFWLGKPTLKNLVEIVRTYLLGSTAGKLPTLAGACLILSLLWRRWPKEKAKTIFLGLWFFLPILMTYMVSQFFQSIFYDRYLLFVIPGALLILASNRRWFSNLFLIGLILSLLVINFNYFTHPTKKPFRDLATLIKEKIGYNDFLINYNSTAHHLFESKYYGLKAPLYVPEGNLPFYVGTALMEKADIVKVIPPGVNRLGVITSGPVEEIHIKDYQLLAYFDVGGLKFARFVPD